MKLRVRLFALSVFLFIVGSCSQMIDLRSDSSAQARATGGVYTYTGANGTIVLSGMSGGNLTVSYATPAAIDSAKLYVSQGNGVGLVLASQAMTYANGSYSYTLNNSTFVAGANVYVCILATKNGVETCVPQGQLANTTSWALIKYGTTDPSPSPVASPTPSVNPSPTPDNGSITITGANGSVVISAMTANSLTVSYTPGFAINSANLYLSQGNGAGLVLASQPMTATSGVYKYTFSNSSYVTGAKIYVLILINKSGTEICVPQGQLSTSTTWSSFTYNSVTASPSPSVVPSPSPSPVASPSPSPSPVVSPSPVPSPTPPNDNAYYGLYRDATYSAATWQMLSTGTKANFAIGDWDSTTSIAYANNVATMTITSAATTKYFSGGTLGQVPLQADGTSYYDFSQVSSIKFWIQSSSLTAADVHFTLQAVGPVNLIDNVALTNYGVSSISSWTEVTIPVSQFTNKKMNVAFALLLGTKVGASVQIKQIGFLTSSGANANVTSTVTWPTYTAASLKASMTKVWADEFNSTTSTTPDPAAWKYDVDADNPYGPTNRWGNAEEEIYTNTRANSYVQGGNLNIVALKDSSGTWTSGRVKTATLKDFTYGYFEIRAKLPIEKGTWPAIWMLPTDTAYGGWPDSGEIDIMEHATNFWGAGNVHGTVHNNANSGAAHGYAGTGIGSAHYDDVNTAFHTYAFYWSPTKIVLFYDDVRLGEYDNPGAGWTSWPYDKRFHLIINLAMGGKLGGTIDPSITQASMQIDYVRVYQ